MLRIIPLATFLFSLLTLSAEAGFTINLDITGSGNVKGVYNSVTVLDSSTDTSVFVDPHNPLDLQMTFTATPVTSVLVNAGPNQTIAVNSNLTVNLAWTKSSQFVEWTGIPTVSLPPFTNTVIVGSVQDNQIYDIGASFNDGTLSSVAFDFDNNGSYETAGNLNNTFSWATLQSLGVANPGSTYTVGVRLIESGGTATDSFDFTIQPLSAVPEPSSFILFSVVAGAGAVGRRFWKKRKAAC